MREIKFRGQRTDSKEWVYGSLLYDGVECYIVTAIDGNFNNVECVTSFEVIPETVGQFTGLPDKNKKEIYEGDILHYAGNYAIVIWEKVTASFRLKYKRNKVMFMAQLSNTIWEQLEIIGNIHQNSELLSNRN